MSNLVKKAQDAGINAKIQAQSAIDARWSPEHRSDVSNSIRAWASQHPKLFFFLSVQALLTGPPVALFVLFSASILLASLLTCIFTALLATVFFTGFCIGAALLVLIPTVFLTASVGIAVFVWGVVSFWLLQKFAESETPVPFAEGLLAKVRALGAQAAPGSEGRNGKIEVNGTDGRSPSNVFGILEPTSNTLSPEDREQRIADIKAANKLKLETVDENTGAKMVA